jgi:RNA polymerase sigma-32 factor
MNRRLGGDVSLNAPIRDDGDSGEWQDWLVAEVSDQETRLVEDEESDNRKKALGEALSVLNERERRIFEARRLADDPITLEDLAAEFGVSRERVRQIEVRAFEKVQKSVKNGVAVTEAPALCRRISFEPSSGGKTADGRVAMSALYGNRMRRKGDRSPINAPKFASYP